MGHSIGDGMIVMALAGAFLGYFYLKHHEKQRRLEIIRQERLAAMDKGIPLPELPIDPPIVEKRPDPHIPLILGTVLITLGAGSMIALRLISASAAAFGFGRQLVDDRLCDRCPDPLDMGNEESIY